MEELKRPEELCEPDPRNRAFVVLDPSAPGGVRPATPEDRYVEMAALELPADVPEKIASAFAIARNLWMYGWYHWPFYALAGFQAYRCMEAALRDRYEREYSGRPDAAPKERLSLKLLLRTAITDGWIRDEGFEHYRRLAERRRHYEDALREFGWLSSEPQTRSPTEYSEILARTIPFLRNEHAHGRGPLALLFNQTRLELELARDLILQALTPREEEAD